MAEIGKESKMGDISVPSSVSTFDSTRYNDISEMEERIKSRFLDYLNYSLELPVLKRNNITHLLEEDFHLIFSSMLTNSLTLIRNCDKSRYFKLACEFNPYMFQDNRKGNQRADFYDIFPEFIYPIFDWMKDCHLVVGHVQSSGELMYFYLRNARDYLTLIYEEQPDSDMEIITIEKKIIDFLSSSKYVKKIENGGYLISHENEDNEYIPMMHLL